MRLSGGTPCLGSKRPSAKLSEEAVREIRRKYAEREADMPTLAAEFGVGKQAICKVVNRRRWAHVCALTLR